MSEISKEDPEPQAWRIPVTTCVSVAIAIPLSAYVIKPAMQGGPGFWGGFLVNVGLVALVAAVVGPLLYWLSPPPKKKRS